MSTQKSPPKHYFYSAKMAPEKVDKLITFEVAKLITLKRAKGGQTSNSPTYIYIYISPFGPFLWSCMHVTARDSSKPSVPSSLAPSLSRVYIYIYMSIFCVSFSLYVSFSFFLFLSLSLYISLSLSLCLFLSLPLSLSLYLLFFCSASLSLSLSLSLTLSLSISLSLWHSLSVNVTHTHSLSLSFFPSFFSPSPSLSQGHILPMAVFKLPLWV